MGCSTPAPGGSDQSCRGHLWRCQASARCPCSRPRSCPCGCSCGSGHGCARCPRLCPAPSPRSAHRTSPRSARAASRAPSASSRSSRYPRARSSRPRPCSASGGCSCPCSRSWVCKPGQADPAKRRDAGPRSVWPGEPQASFTAAPGRRAPPGAPARVWQGSAQRRFRRQGRKVSQRKHAVWICSIHGQTAGALWHQRSQPYPIR